MRRERIEQIRPIEFSDELLPNRRTKKRPRQESLRRPTVIVEDTRLPRPIDLVRETAADNEQNSRQALEADDLDELLDAKSPLLARAFRAAKGTESE